jgi:hypothetical protein
MTKWTPRSRGDLYWNPPIAMACIGVKLIAGGETEKMVNEDMVQVGHQELRR